MARLKDDLAESRALRSLAEAAVAVAGDKDPDRTARIAAGVLRRRMHCLPSDGVVERHVAVGWTQEYLASEQNAVIERQARLRAAVGKTWDEARHPRDHGRFAERASGSAAAPTPTSLVRAFENLSRRHYGLVPIASLADELQVPAEDLHPLIQQLRRDGVLSGQGIEGGPSLPATERARLIGAAINEHGSSIGYLSVRDEDRFRRLLDG
jgi:hypothetical protein